MNADNNTIKEWEYLNDESNNDDQSNIEQEINYKDFGNGNIRFEPFAFKNEGSYKFEFKTYFSSNDDKFTTQIVTINISKRTLIVKIDGNSLKIPRSLSFTLDGSLSYDTDIVDTQKP